MCREKSCLTVWVVGDIGSPLSVQGKVESIGIRQNQLRITPACAGKSVPPSTINFVSEDHPCVCREKLISNPNLYLMGGSPLRVQGKEQ